MTKNRMREDEYLRTICTHCSSIRVFCWLNLSFRHCKWISSNQFTWFYEGCDGSEVLYHQLADLLFHILSNMIYGTTIAWIIICTLSPFTAVSCSMHKWERRFMTYQCLAGCGTCWTIDLWLYTHVLNSCPAHFVLHWQGVLFDWLVIDWCLTGKGHWWLG